MHSSVRTTLVTGGTGGIGREVAFELGRRGDRVLFVGRDEARGKAVLETLRTLTPGVDHRFFDADLSLLAEARRAAELVLQHTKRLDAVVLCAGVLSLVPEETAEGLERTLALNYLSRHLLVRRLLPLLEDAPSGRVVFVANAGRYPDTLDFDDLQLRSGGRGLHVAGRTQFANDLLAVELAERLCGTRLEVTCVFPGVAKTDVFRNARGVPWYLKAVGKLLELTAMAPADAAVTPVHLAHSDEARHVSGRFFGPGKTELPVPERARNPERRRLLWSASETLIAPYLALPSLRVHQHARVEDAGRVERTLGSAERSGEG